MEDLATSKDQLALVLHQLNNDPENEDLLSLKAELIELIALTEAAVAASKPKDKGKGKEKAAPRESNTNWQEQGEYVAGADCMAKYKDGKLWVVQ